MHKFTVVTPILLATFFVFTRQSPIQSGPRELTQSTSSSLTVRWDIASDALYYKVLYRQKGVKSEWKSIVETFENEFTITNLLPDTVYEIVLKKRSKVTYDETEERKEERRTAPVVNGDFGPLAKTLDVLDELVESNELDYTAETGSFDKCEEEVWNRTILPTVKDLGSKTETSIAKLRRVRDQIIEVKKQIKVVENKRNSFQCQAAKVKVSASEVEATELLNKLNDEREKWIMNENELATNLDDILERLKLVRQHQLADIAALNTLTLQAAKMVEVDKAEAKIQAEAIREQIKDIRQRVQRRMTDQK